MADTFGLEIYASNKLAFAGRAKTLTIPAVDGEQAFLAQHENIVAAIIPGEIIEWTILSYIRDAAYMGKHKACFNIWHFNMEELGMKYAADWIGELLNNEIPVNYIPTEDGWTFL